VWLEAHEVRVPEGIGPVGIPEVRGVDRTLSIPSSAVLKSQVCRTEDPFGVLSKEEKLNRSPEV
jgi:hypothetical protein